MVGVSEYSWRPELCGSRAQVLHDEYVRGIAKWLVARRCDFCLVLFLFGSHSKLLAGYRYGSYTMGINCKYENTEHVACLSYIYRSLR